MPAILNPIVEAAPGEDLTYPEALRRSAQVYAEELDVLAADDYRRPFVEERLAEYAAAAERWDACLYAAQGGCTVEDCTPVPVGGYAHPHRDEPEPTATKTDDESAAPDQFGPGVAAMLVHPVTGTTIPVPEGLFERAMQRTGTDAATKSEPEAAGRIPSRLIYADEVTEGMGLVYEKPCPHHGGLAGMLSGPHEHGQGVASVLRLRQGEGAMSHLITAVVLDEDGEQQPRAWNTIELVRVAVEG